MLTLVVYALLAVGLIGGLFLLAARLLPAGEQIAPPVRDEPIWSLPRDRRMQAVDVAEVRLPVALRGYRFAETDELLDRLADELRLRDEELARLRGALPAADGQTLPPRHAQPDGLDTTVHAPEGQDALDAHDVLDAPSGGHHARAAGETETAQDSDG